MNKTKISLVIPARNAERTLDSCLQAVFNSRSIPDQVIIINDDSEDQTAFIAAKYDCEFYSIHSKTGPMEPRYAGARKAKHDILVFIDADVVVHENTFEMIRDALIDDKVSALTGVLADTYQAQSFWSDYKNLYMHYIFSRLNKDSDFLYGSIWAIRSQEMLYFPCIEKPFGSLVSDSEMGFWLKQKGKNILLKHDLEVNHLKTYSLGSLLKNDFVIPFMFAIMNKKYFNLYLQHKNRFSHATLGQVIINTVSFLTFLLFGSVIFSRNPICWYLALSGLTAIFIYWFPFIKHIYQKRNFKMTVKAILFIPWDSCVMFLGMTAGFIYAVGVKE